MDPEVSIRKTRLRGGRFGHGGQFALDADVDKPGAVIPGRGRDGDRRLEGMRAFGRGVGIGEIVDDFLDADGFARAAGTPGHQGGTDDGIGRRVDVDGEGGDGLFPRDLEGVFRGVGEFLGVAFGRDDRRRDAEGRRKGLVAGAMASTAEAGANSA